MSREDGDTVADDAPQPRKPTPDSISLSPAELEQRKGDTGRFEAKVTFNKKMKDGNWSWVTLVKENFPETTDKPRYEEGQKTCILPVKLEPGKSYTIGINSSKFGNFKDMAGRSAVPLVLEFKTKS